MPHQGTFDLLMVSALVTINQRDRESSDLIIYRSEVDTQDTSTWRP